MGPNPQETADLVIVTGEILNGKLHFLCSVTVLANGVQPQKQHYFFSCSASNINKIRTP